MTEQLSMHVECNKAVNGVHEMRGFNCHLVQQLQMRPAAQMQLMTTATHNVLCLTCTGFVAIIPINCQY